MEIQLIEAAFNYISESRRFHWQVRVIELQKELQYP
jgi:hypothetical protein